MTDQELRLTSDTFLAKIERLQALEDQKRQLAPADMADIAHEVEDLTLGDPGLGAAPDQPRGVGRGGGRARPADRHRPAARPA